MSELQNKNSFMALGETNSRLRSGNIDPTSLQPKDSLNTLTDLLSKKSHIGQDLVPRASNILLGAGARGNQTDQDFSNYFKSLAQVDSDLNMVPSEIRFLRSQNNIPGAFTQPMKVDSVFKRNSNFSAPINMNFQHSELQQKTSQTNSQKILPQPFSGLKPISSMMARTITQSLQKANDDARSKQIQKYDKEEEKIPTSNGSKKDDKEMKQDQEKKYSQARSIEIQQTLEKQKRKGCRNKKNWKNKDQVDALEREFQIDGNWDFDKKVDLAIKLNLTTTQVSKWLWEKKKKLKADGIIE